MVMLTVTMTQPRRTWNMDQVVTGTSAHVPMQRNSMYIRKYGQMVYLQYQTTRTPSLTNIQIRTTPIGTPFTDPLHGILPRHDPTLLYVYVYVYVYVYIYGYGYVYGPTHLCRHHDNHEHCTAAS